MRQLKHRGNEPAPVMKSYGSQSRATYDTHDGVGVAGIAAVLGMGIILAGRLDFGWGFLAMALVVVGIFARGLYWRRKRRNPKISPSMPSASTVQRKDPAKNQRHSQET